MLTSMVKDHNSKMQKRREVIEQKKKIASDSSIALTHNIVDHLNTGVAQAYVNQKKLDTENKLLHANTEKFIKQTHQWLKLVENFSVSLKEIGDVENWASSIEKDMYTISSALEYAYKDANEKS